MRKAAVRAECLNHAGQGVIHNQLDDDDDDHEDDEDDDDYDDDDDDEGLQCGVVNPSWSGFEINIYDTVD